MSRPLDVQPKSYVKQLTCDRCNLTASIEEHEFNNFVSLDFDCTWGSVLGDGHHVDLDLCHSCVDAVLGPWLRITASGWTKPAIGEWSDFGAPMLNPDAESVSLPRLRPTIEPEIRIGAAELVMSGTRWLTATELCVELPTHTIDAENALTQWLEKGKIFALESNGVLTYPLYAFDPLGEPIPFLKLVLDILEGYSPFHIAAWFESPSSYLRGQRPREALGSEGASVVLAAKRMVEGAVHG